MLYIRGWLIEMSGRLEELSRIHEEILSDPENVPKKTRVGFWKIVREIKRQSNPDHNEIAKAAEIRDILFEIRRGKTYSLKSTLSIQFLIGIIIAIIPYLYLLSFPLDWTQILVWTMDDWIQFGLRFITVFLGIALFYPIGRLIGAKALGIKTMGVCWDDYKEPTIRIDYVTFLSLPPNRRKWFFFIGGIWTVITSLLLWLVGMFFAMDYTALIPLIVLLLFEGAVIASGNPSHTRGEMGSFNRERKIEREWKQLSEQ